MEDIRKMIDNNYTKENGKQILKEAIYNSITAQNTKINDDIKNELDIYSKRIKDEMCPRELENFYLAGVLKNNDLPLTQFIANTYKNNILKWNECFIWDGHNEFNGLINIIGKDNSVIDISNELIKEESYINKVEKLIKHAPNEVLNNKPVIFCSHNFLGKYYAELKEKYDKCITPELFIDGTSIIIPDTDIKLIATCAITNITCEGEPIILTSADNIIINIKLDDETYFDIQYSEKYDEVDINAQWKIGAKIESSNLIVRGYSL